MRCVRIWFDKVGEIKYISHLDLMRCFTRAIRRAKIPLWFTEGYNPRPYMQFALPLSLGMESVCESVDIRIEGEITDSEVLSSLSAVMPKGIKIKSVTQPVYDPKYIAFGEFDIVFSLASDVLRLKELISQTLLSDEIIVEKIGKKGRQKAVKQINLARHIQNAKVKVYDSRVVVSMTLPAGSVNNINPSLFAEKIIETYGQTLAVDIMRKRLLLESGEEFK